MENNRIEKRINIIKENLRKESCGVLLADMTAKQKTQLCSVFNVSENEIVGYYEDIMNLGKTLLANVRGKFSNQGLLFLKEAFVYRKKSIDGITRVYYDDITLVETGSFGTKVDYNFKGKTASLFLSGIAYADSNEVIPDLLIHLNKLSSAKVTSAQRVKQSEVKKETKREERQDNIDKWNAHIRECARKNRIAQIKHLEDYMQFPSFAYSVIMAKMVCINREEGVETCIVLYSKDGIEFNCYDFPIEQNEIKRVLFKVIPFFTICNDDNKEWWLRREEWNHGSNYDCDDSYEGKRYVMDYLFGNKQEEHDTSIKTENDVFIQKDEIQYLPNRALLYLADIIDVWQENNLAEIVGNYDLWKKKREFIISYKPPIAEEIEKRGIKRFSNINDNFDSTITDDQFINYGEQGEKDVEYALKWLPSEYKKIERTDSEGIRLLDLSVSDESQEIDHIVVGANGVFLIETKHLKGNISIDHNGNWSRVVDGEIKGIRNPIQQVDRHHTIVKSILEEMVSDKDIHDIICLSYIDSTIEGAENSPVPVVRLELLDRYIIDCESTKTYSDAETNTIISIIEEYRIN